MTEHPNTANIDDKEHHDDKKHHDDEGITITKSITTTKITGTTGTLIPTPSKTYVMQLAMLILPLR